MKNNYKPYFSIVIPTYNRAESLKSCLQSVFDQTYNNFEILLVDNGSTDSTRHIYERFKDQRLRYIYQEGSGSPASPRNTGIKNAMGEWVCFLDSDDIWYKSKLESVKKAIDSSNIELDVIFHNELSINSQTKKSCATNNNRKVNYKYKDMLLERNCLSPSATSLRRRYIREREFYFNEEKSFDTVEDYDLWLTLAHSGAKFLHLDRVLGEYILHDSNLIYTNPYHLDNLDNVIKKHVYEIQTFEEDKEYLYKKLRCKLLLIKASKSFSERDIIRAFSLIISAMVYDFKSTIGYFRTFLKG